MNFSFQRNLHINRTYDFEVIRSSNITLFVVYTKAIPSNSSVWISQFFFMIRPNVKEKLYYIWRNKYYGSNDYDQKKFFLFSRFQDNRCFFSLKFEAISDVPLPKQNGKDTRDRQTYRLNTLIFMLPGIWNIHKSWAIDWNKKIMVKNNNEIYYNECPKWRSKTSIYF